MFQTDQGRFQSTGTKAVKIGWSLVTFEGQSQEHILTDGM